jgi:VIT1/CCC1 family predicted Fe2+/Mn2+ transporter
LRFAFFLALRLGAAFFLAAFFFTAFRLGAAFFLAAFFLAAFFFTAYALAWLSGEG